MSDGKWVEEKFYAAKNQITEFFTRNIKLKKGSMSEKDS